MPASEIREILRYVPQFSGATFLIAIQSEEIEQSGIAELILDLSIAQQLGVKLLMVIDSPTPDTIVEHFEEHEMRFQPLDAGELNGVEIAEKVEACFGRKQAVVVTLSESEKVSPFLEEASQQLSLDKLIFVTADSGIRRNGAPIPAVNLAEAKAMIHSPQISGKAWLEKALKFCELGVPRVHVLEGNFPGVLVAELFSNQGIGTMIYRDEYRVIRPVTEEDISEVLAIVGRPVRSSSLIPRDFETIASQMRDYYVMTIDKHVMGCVALHVYEPEDSAEIACLFVRPEQSGRSYGRELVEFAIEVARQKKVGSVFAITKSAGSFFQHELGFQEQEVSVVPEKRREMLLASSRSSLVFSKSL